MSGTWTSPPGGIEAGTNNHRFSNALDTNIQREQRSIRLPSLQPTMPTQTGGASAGAPTIRIEIEHSNVPQDVTMRPSVSGGGAEIGGIRVRRAMPEAGMMPIFGGT